MCFTSASFSTYAFFLWGGCSPPLYENIFPLLTPVQWRWRNCCWTIRSRYLSCWGQFSLGLVSGRGREPCRSSVEPINPSLLEVTQEMINLKIVRNSLHNGVEHSWNIVNRNHRQHHESLSQESRSEEWSGPSAQSPDQCWRLFSRPCSQVGWGCGWLPGSSGNSIRQSRLQGRWKRGLTEWLARIQTLSLEVGGL